MPTGFTSGVYDGNTDFNAFILRCARGMSPLISMRDTPFYTAIPRVFDPSFYHFDHLQEAKLRLESVQAMTPEECRVQAQADLDQMAAADARIEKSDQERRARYEAMLTKARAWTPPTPDHVGLQRFMVAQIEESMAFDCGHRQKPKEPKEVDSASAVEWQRREVEKALRDIDYHEAAWTNEQKIARKNTAWVQALLDSLETP